MTRILKTCTRAAAFWIAWSLSTSAVPGARAEQPTVAVVERASETSARLPTPEIRRDPKGNVIISCPATNFVIRYTLDGSAPAREAGAYLAPIEFPYGGIVKASAFELGSTNHGPVSSVAFQALPGTTTSRPPSTLLPVSQNRDWRIYDWPARHAAVCQLVRARNPRLIFIGDSITHFFGGEPVGPIVNGGDVWQKFYARRNALNLGFGWDRTENVLWRLKHGELEGASPKVGVVLIGTNNMDVNSPEEIAAGIAAICHELHARSPGTKILLLAILPRAQRPDARRVKMAELNARIAKLDGKDGVSFLDIGRKFVSKDGTISSELMADFLHPTAKGYELFAEAIEPALARMLGEERSAPK